MPRTSKTQKTYKAQFHKKNHALSAIYLPKDVRNFFNHFSVKTFFFVILISMIFSGEWNRLDRLGLGVDRSFAFAGALERFEGGSMWVLGAFSLADGSFASGPDRLVEARILPGTRFQEIILEEDASRGETSSRLVPGSLEDLSRGEVAGVYVVSEGSVYGESAFAASEVRYIRAEE